MSQSSPPVIISGLVSPLHSHLVPQLELLDLLQFSLTTVLSGHFVLSPPPDISAGVQLVLGQVALAQQIIELVHGETDQGLAVTQNTPQITSDTSQTVPPTNLNCERNFCFLGELLILPQSFGRYYDATPPSHGGKISGKVCSAVGSGVLPLRVKVSPLSELLVFCILSCQLNYDKTARSVCFILPAGTAGKGRSPDLTDHWQ